MTDATGVARKSEPRVAVVDDDPEGLATLKNLLDDHFDVQAHDGPTAALEALARAPVDVVVCNQTMRDRSGMAFLAELRSLHPAIKTIVLTPFADVDAIMADPRQDSVDFFLTKPVDGAQLVRAVGKVWDELQDDQRRSDLVSRCHAEVADLQRKMAERELQKGDLEGLLDCTGALAQALQDAHGQLRLLTLLNESLSLQATIDPLTSLQNRRELYHRLSVEWARYQRHLRPLSLILLDIDHFKDVNDTYGHECGDMVLRTLALLMRSNVRMQDMVFRYGGEEFVVVLPETPLLAAFHVAENLRSRVAAHRFTCGTNVLQIHISLGVAGVKEHGLATEEALINQADRSMYRAKQSGRNRTVVLNSDDPDKILYQTQG